jgi:hypothetical protein
MRPAGVVVDPPVFDDAAGSGQAAEQMLVEAIVAEAAVRALDEGLPGAVWLGLNVCLIVSYSA